MSTVAGRALATCAAIVLAILSSPPAQADLPRHVLVDRFGPLGEDFPPEDFTDIRFGEAVAIRNGIGFIGIPKARDGGHVAVLNLSTSGWKRVDTLRAPASRRETRFGRSLTFRDGVLVVGGANAAYVFRRSNGIWTLRQTLLPSPFASIDFPRALRYEGGVLVTSVRSGLAPPFGAPGYVIVWELNSTGSFVSKVGIVGFPVGPDEDFGVDISMTSRQFVVGSPAGTRGPVAGVPAYDKTGAVFRFGRDRTGHWGQFQRLVPSEPAPGFGTSVAVDNDMIVVGAPKIDVEGLPAGPATADGHNAGGAAYVFVPGNRYVQVLKLRPRSDEVFRYQDFGYRVAMMGSYIVIAATRPHGADGLFPPGLVVTYSRDGTSVQPWGVAQGHIVAASVGLANGWLLLGTPYERSCLSDCVGSASIYNINRFAP